ncbi:Tol-Pal system protein TolB [subsurface metagenome]
MCRQRGGAFKALHKTQWTGKFIKGDASLSPDGKYIIFADGKEDNMDLYIINAKGGTPILISGNPANEYDPLWSPDGKYMVYIKETKGESLLYALEITEGNPTGQPFLIKEGMQNVDLMNWTEYGIDYIMSFNLHDIYTIQLDTETGIPTANPKPLDYTPVGSNICPVWSYDGKYLAFISYDDKPELVVLTVDGGETRYYPIHAPGFWELTLFDLHWLPDDSGLGFSVRDPKEIPTIYHLDLASGEWQNWVLPINSSWSLTEWGPDENSFIYTSGGEEPGIYQFNIKTEETKRIFQPEESSYYLFRGLKFSRDRTKVTFIYQSEMDIINLMVLDIESGEAKILAKNCYFPAFSPDGQKIVAHYDSKITIFSLDGEILQQYNLYKHFTSGTRIYCFDWSPDGKQLMFMTRNSVVGTFLMKNVLE